MSSLTDRYLAATLGSVPAHRREEIAPELRASIEDAVDDRVGAGQDQSTAEREVLTDLGNPQLLAARYTGQRLQLIGPAYYLAWWNLLRTLLAYVPALVGTVVGLVHLVDGDGFGAIGPAIGTALSVAVHVAFWVTLVFAIWERTGDARHLPRWSLDDLPEATTERQITLSDTVAAVVVLLFTVGVAFFPTQQLRFGDGEQLAVVDPALWGFWLPVLLAVVVAMIVFEFVKYRVGHWTWGMVVVNAVLGVAFAVPVIWLLLTEQLLNPELVARFEWLREGDNLGTVTVIAVVSIVVITIWDVVDSVLKARRWPR
ncbi:permease prefix domain 1-containing protein [Micromonospora fluostatini]